MDNVLYSQLASAGIEIYIVQILISFTGFGLALLAAAYVAAKMMKKDTFSFPVNTLFNFGSKILFFLGFLNFIYFLIDIISDNIEDEFDNQRLVSVLFLLVIGVVVWIVGERNTEKEEDGKKLSSAMTNILFLFVIIFSSLLLSVSLTSLDSDEWLVGPQAYAISSLISALIIIGINSMDIDLRIASKIDSRKKKSEK